VLLSALYFRVDVFLLERWTGTTAVGLYNAVFRIVDALRLFPAAVLAVSLPVLCRAQDLRPVVRLAAPLTAAACGTTAVLWISAAWIVPDLYGGAYTEAVRPFRTLLLAFPLMTLNYALTQQLIGWHGQRAYAVICAGALGFNLLLNAHLIPALGMNGAAWSTLWTEAFLTIGCGLALTRTMPASEPPLAMSGHVSLEDRA
jgi:O-antigen/teichoic acid export membrane protein